MEQSHTRRASDHTPRVAIVTDAGCDVPRIERGDAPWTVVPATVVYAGREIVDDGEASRSLVAAALDSSAHIVEPTTDAWAAAFDRHRDCDRVYSMHPAASLSDGIGRARSAAGDDPRIRVIETRAASIAVGLIGVLLARRVAAGAPLAHLDAYAVALAREAHVFVVPDHFDPRANQRELAARVLAGKPMMSLVGGRTVHGRRLRSRRATIAAIERYFDAHAPRATDRAGAILHLAIGHADAAGAVDPFLDIIERLRPEATIELVGRLGPAIVHGVGARCVGLAWASAPAYPT